MKTKERLHRIKAYQDAKFGIFMHWGPMAGKWEGRDDEWVTKDRAEILPYVKAFEESTKGLKIEDWFTFFEKVGAKYFSFVSQHCVNMYYNFYPSDVMTLCSKRDYLGEISDACRKHNMSLIVYQPLGVEGFHRWIKEGMPDCDTFMEKMVHTMELQMHELTERYHPQGIWLDGWPFFKLRFTQAGKEPLEYFRFDKIVEAVHNVDSDVLIGNKELFDPYIDYTCSEYIFNDHFGNRISGEKVPCEVTETLPGSVDWFANVNQVVLTKEELEKQQRIFVKRFFSVVGMGMNYLLNVGPDQEGRIAEVDCQILQYMGDYIRRFTEAIYGTRYEDAYSYSWGYLVQKGNEHYLYVLDNREIVDAITCHNSCNKGDSSWQKVGLSVSVAFHLNRDIAEVILLNDGREMPFEQCGNVVTVNTSGLNMESDDVLVFQVREKHDK